MVHKILKSKQIHSPTEIHLSVIFHAVVNQCLNLNSSELYCFEANGIFCFQKDSIDRKKSQSIVAVVFVSYEEI